MKEDSLELILQLLFACIFIGMLFGFWLGRRINDVTRFLPKNLLRIEGSLTFVLTPIKRDEDPTPDQYGLQRYLKQIFPKDPMIIQRVSARYQYEDEQIYHTLIVEN